MNYELKTLSEFTKTVSEFTKIKNLTDKIVRNLKNIFTFAKRTKQTT